MNTKVKILAVLSVNLKTEFIISIPIGIVQSPSMQGSDK